MRTMRLVRYILARTDDETGGFNQHADPVGSLSLISTGTAQAYAGEGRYPRPDVLHVHVLRAADRLENQRGHRRRLAQYGGRVDLDQGRVRRRSSDGRRGLLPGLRLHFRCDLQGGRMYYETLSKNPRPRSSEVYRFLRGCGGLAALWRYRIFRGVPADACQHRPGQGAETALSGYPDHLRRR